MMIFDPRIFLIFAVLKRENMKGFLISLLCLSVIGCGSNPEPEIKDIENAISTSKNNGLFTWGIEIGHYKNRKWEIVSSKVDGEKAKSEAKFEGIFEETFLGKTSRKKHESDFTISWKWNVDSWEIVKAKGKNLREIK